MRHLCDKLRSAVALFLALAVSAPVYPQTNTQSRPLSTGIARNQQELQELKKLVSDNNKDMGIIAAEAYASLMSAIAGINPSEFGQSGQEAAANLLSALGNLKSALETGKSALDGNTWLTISNQLKLVMDLVGEEDLQVRLANTGLDLLVKTSQLVALSRENAELVAAEVKIAKAQSYLQQKAASMQMRQAASQSPLLPKMTQLTDLQKQWLEQQYKDRPKVIELAVKLAADRNSLAGSQVARGIIVDPQSNVDALAKIPGINPDFIASLRMQFDLLQKGDLESVNAAYYLDRYPDGSYINIFGPRPSNIRVFQPKKDSDLTPPPLPENSLQEGIKLRYEKRPGRTGVWVHGAEGQAAEGQVLDPSEKSTYGRVNLGGFKDLDPGSYAFAFTLPGFRRLPFEVRKGWVTSITVTPGILSLRHDDPKTCLCMADPQANQILVYMESFPMCLSGNTKYNSLGMAPSKFGLGPGTYKAIVVDANMFGGCTRQLHAGSASISVTLHANETVIVTAAGASK